MLVVVAMADQGGIRGLAWKLAQKLLAPNSKDGFVPSSWKGGEAKIVVPGTEETFLWHIPEWDSLGKAVAQTGWASWQQGLAVDLTAALQKAAVVVDVGCATGVVTLLALAAAPSSRLIAIDPLPEMQAALQKSLAANGWGRRVQLIGCAVADRDTPKVRFLVKENLLASRLPQPNDTGAVTRIAEVGIFKLDTLLAKERKIDLIKLSADGVEEPALRGLQATLQRTQPQFILLGQWRPAAQKFLAPLGYQLHDIAGGLWAKPPARA